MTDLDAAATLVLRQSRAKIALGVLLAGAMLAMCIWLDLTGPPHGARGAFARFVGTPVFGLVTLAFTWSLLFPGRLELSQEGVHLRRLPGGFRLAWPRVGHVQVVNPWFTENVQVSLIPTGKKTLPPAWERKPAEIAQAIEEARARWGSGAA